MTDQPTTTSPEGEVADALAFLRESVTRYKTKRSQDPQWALMASDNPLARAGITSAHGVRFHIEDGVTLMPERGDDIEIKGSTIRLSVEHPFPGDDA